MSKTQKAKSNKGDRNDGRKNGKAAKQNPGRKATGSRHNPISEVDKILIGGGLLSKWRGVIDGKVKGI